MSQYRRICGLPWDLLLLLFVLASGLSAIFIIGLFQEDIRMSFWIVIGGSTAWGIVCACVMALYSPYFIQRELPILSRIRSEGPLSQGAFTSLNSGDGRSPSIPDSDSSSNEEKRHAR
jgi:hypothetical protein